MVIKPGGHVICEGVGDESGLVDSEYSDYTRYDISFRKNEEITDRVIQIKYISSDLSCDTNQLNLTNNVFQSSHFKVDAIKFDKETGSDYKITHH